MVYHPGDGRSLFPSLYLDARDSTNRISVGEIVEDATERRSRVFVGGNGQWPEQHVVSSTDPDLATGTILLRETSRSEQVDDVNVLFDYARAERLERSAAIQQIPVTHPDGYPAISSYQVGDRARIRIADEFMVLDERGVRIIDKSVSKTPATPVQATVMLDMTDIRDVY
jgi:hypothetical protein